MLSEFTNFVSRFMSDDNKLDIPIMSLSDFIEPALQYQKHAVSQHIDPDMINRTIHYT